MRGVFLKKSIEIINHSVFFPLLQWIYPPCCVLCESARIDGFNQVCANCWGKLPRATDTALENLWLTREQDQSIFISHFHAFFEFNENIQAIIHEMKYNGRTRIARELILVLENDIRDFFNRFTNIEAIIPIPLHDKKIHERGYNQSELLTTEIARIVSLPVLINAVVRIKNTQSQTKLDAQDRLKNMDNAFSIHNNLEIQGKMILLVDDLITTGSTINECAKVLIKGGAKEVAALTIARA